MIVQDKLHSENLQHQNQEDKAVQANQLHQQHCKILQFGQSNAYQQLKAAGSIKEGAHAQVMVHSNSIEHFIQQDTVPIEDHNLRPGKFAKDTTNMDANSTIQKPM